uniref:ZF-HD dimerization-type domain-containing protein n=1 Tax=Brassica campestris TaxID=3711 RepID=M4E9A7_BRACM
MLEVGAMEMTPKSPEPESETPTRIQPAKPISFSNGIIKRHHHIHHHTLTVTYKECLKNHAAAIGGHALDGCGEFMPSPSSTPSDPTSLKCAACGCHRNFHRRDPDDSSLASAVPPPSLPPSSTTAAIEYQPHHRHHPPPPAPPLPRSPTSSSPPPISSSYMLLALSGNNKPGGNSLPFSDLNFAANNLSTHHHHHNHNHHTPGSRKRFRTKFSQTQKDKMHEFADRIGWKIQKRDEGEVRDFCRDVGVDKGVLKVWMHNNKNTFNTRRDQPFSGDTTVQKIDNGVAVSGGKNINNNNNNNNNNNAVDVGVHGGNGLEHDLHGGDGGRFESDSGGAAANGSSSTS